MSQRAPANVEYVAGRPERRCQSLSAVSVHCRHNVTFPVSRPVTTTSADRRDWLQIWPRTDQCRQARFRLIAASYWPVCAAVREWVDQRRPSSNKRNGERNAYQLSQMDPRDAPWQLKSYQLLVVSSGCTGWVKKVYCCTVTDISKASQ